MQRIVIGLFAILSVLAIASCFDTNREMSQSHYQRMGIDQIFMYGARDGTIPAVVVGNPFGGNKSAFDRAVVDAMGKTFRGPPTRFVATPANGAHPYIRMVMLFDPPATADGYTICRDVRALPSQRTADRMRVIGALCAGDEVQSDVVASTPVATATGPDAPGFHRMIAAVMQTIIPIQSPDQGRSCGRDVC